MEEKLCEWRGQAVQGRVRERGVCRWTEWCIHMCFKKGPRDLQFHFHPSQTPYIFIWSGRSPSMTPSELCFLSALFKTWYFVLLYHRISCPAFKGVTTHSNLSSEIAPDMGYLFTVYYWLKKWQGMQQRVVCASNNSYCYIQFEQIVLLWSLVNREDTTFVVEGVETI